MNAATEQSFLDEIVAASGLAPLLAPFTVTRLLIKAGVTPATVDADGLRRALPELEHGLAVYLSPEQLEEALARLRDLAAR
ncbi:MAG TPA: hypothetical protein VM204_00180 [Gaiellaceae bacterium]|nr:hypothetical protein [Gaiellaceae bacterium]